MSAGLEGYAITFRPLEQLVAGKGSAERLIWSEENKASFKVAKDMVASVKGIYYPLPTDRLRTYSVFSQEANAVGGRLEFVRTDEKGKETIFHGGFFSASLNSNQKRWLPCEAECLGVKLVIEHFASIIRESQSPVTHYCDNLVTFFCVSCPNSLWANAYEILVDFFIIFSIFY